MKACAQMAVFSAPCSSRGVNDARSGLADIGMASRSLSATESDLPPVPATIARDGIAIIVHRDNPVRTLPVPNGRHRRRLSGGGGDGREER